MPWWSWVILGAAAVGIAVAVFGLWTVYRFHKESGL